MAQWSPPKVCDPLLNLMENILQLQGRGWIRQSPSFLSSTTLHQATWYALDHHPAWRVTFLCFSTCGLAAIQHLGLETYFCPVKPCLPAHTVLAKLLVLFLTWSQVGVFTVRRQVFWMAKQVLQLGMGDALDDWLLGKIRWLRREEVVASGFQLLRKVCF